MIMLRRVGRGVVAAGAQRRVLSSSSSPSSSAFPAPSRLTSHQAVATSRIILDILRFGVSGQRLDLLNTDEARKQPLQERWAQAMQVLVATQAHCATAFGYEPSSQGVMQYRGHLTQQLRSGEDPEDQLKTLEDEVWSEVLLRAFALPPKPMSLDEARAFSQRVVADIADRKDVAEGLAEKVAALAEADRDVQALQLVQNTIFDLQLDLAPAFGFDGDGGFVQLQAALVSHVLVDPVVMHTTSAAMHTLCQKANVKPPF
mmetsp:Transcript_3511/g.11519  ORF Transcript_3511/g.11519 Transcript_3511/m.11519 type:complete len:259 (+) Transcript_3511:701-1477(+)